MASVKDTATFFAEGTATQFEHVLKLYPQALRLKAENHKSKKPEELIKLDNWWVKENEGERRAPRRSSSSGPQWRRQSAVCSLRLVPVPLSSLISIIYGTLGYGFSNVRGLFWILERALDFGARGFYTPQRRRGDITLPCAARGDNEPWVATVSRFLTCKRSVNPSGSYPTV